MRNYSIPIYLKNGTLPWLKFKKENKKEYLDNILKMHYNISEDELFDGFSKEVKFIFSSLKDLKPEENLEYEIYIQNFELALFRLKEKS